MSAGKRAPKEPVACAVEMPSRALVGHVHTCRDVHAVGHHRCSDKSCGRYFEPGPVRA